MKQPQSTQPPLAQPSLALRGSLITLTDSPYEKSPTDVLEIEPDGILWIEDGHIRQRGPAAELLPKLPKNIPLHRYPDSLILPGFIDLHTHYPQTEMIASYGEQLLEWLEKYTYPTEQKFKDPKHATKIAKFFLSELLKNGTTTAMVFASVHPESVDALFTEAQKLNLRLFAGKVLMDRNAPEFLLDTPERAYTESKDLIKRWHGKGRLHYAITPRFAITSTPEQLEMAGKLKKEFPDVYIQTHLSENRKEVQLVHELFPDASDYLAVYEKYGLSGERTIFAHSLCLTESEWSRLSKSKSSIAFCPTSNLFLGSGLFRLDQTMRKDQPVRVGLGTDVGAGNSFSMLRVINEAYKVEQLQERRLSGIKALYLATLSGARALGIDSKVGSLANGNEADLVVLSAKAQPLTQLRAEMAQAFHKDPKIKVLDKLFTFFMLGDDRNVEATYILGNHYEPTDSN